MFKIGFLLNSRDMQTRRCAEILTLRLPLMQVLKSWKSIAVTCKETFEDISITVEQIDIDISV